MHSNDNVQYHKGALKHMTSPECINLLGCNTPVILQHSIISHPTLLIEGAIELKKIC